MLHPSSFEPGFAESSDALLRLVASPALARLLIHFVLHPQRPLGFRALQRHTGLGHRSLVNELDRLAVLGIVRREAQLGSHGPVYQAQPRARIWRLVRDLVRETAAPWNILRDALVDLPKLELAFVYGSTATGEARSDSDVDLLIVGTHLDATAIAAETLEAAALLGREVNVTRYTPEQLRTRAKTGGRFTRTVLPGPKRWVRGDEIQLAKLLA